MTKKKTRGSDDADYFERRKGEISGWAQKPTTASIETSGSVVFSLRLAPNELEEIRRAAAARGSTVSELVRSATLSEVRGLPSRPVSTTSNTSGSIAPLLSLSGGEVCSFPTETI